MILTKEVEIKVHSNTVEYYKSLGYEIPLKKASKTYFEKTGKEFFYDTSKTITVDISDLQKHSNVKIEVLCDICNQNKSMIKYNDYTKCVENTGNYACRQCWHEKASKTNQERYGFSSVLKNEEIKEKVAKTNLERYGVIRYGQTKDFLEKLKQTCLTKYGVEHFSKLQEVQNKKKKTNLERYGVPCVLQSPEVCEKIHQTLYRHGTQKTSKQQYYLHKLFGGELNYPIKYYSADICFPDEKFVVEYDGGFHNGQVKTGKITQEEFNQKEIARNNIIKREGYNQMRIISSKDLLPSNEILLRMLQQAREYFNTTSHSWINFDIDNSRMINAENKDVGGVFFDYGELHKIKESDFVEVA